MKTKNFKIVSKLAIEYLTDCYTKSKSIIYMLFNARKKLIEFVSKKGNFDFDEALNFIRVNQKNWNKGTFKAIKRLVYSIYDYEINGHFTTKKFVYYNTTKLILLLDSNDSNLITKYLALKKYKSEYGGVVSNILANFYFYLKEKKVTIYDLNPIIFENLYDYFKTKFSKTHFLRSIIKIKEYVNFYYEKYDMQANFLFMLDHRIMKHYKYLKSIVEKNEVLNRLENAAQIILTQTMFSEDYIEEFIEIIKNYNYSKKYTETIDFQVRLYNLFLYLTNYKYSTELVEYWIENIIRPRNSGYLSFRNRILRFTEFLNSKFHFIDSFLNFKIEKIYSRPTKFEISLPEWSKQNVESYLKYRRRIGCAENTITNDKNAILSFTIYLNERNISTFKDITPHLLIDYSKNEIHSTIEGKNNYVIRVKGFITCLQDKNIIDQFDLSSILHGGRTEQKIKTILSDDTIKKIYNLKESLTSARDIRAYTIFIIGIRLGIRSSDIINLKFENISFKNMTISFIQSKTKKFINLPMPMEVANAIYNYTKYARPKSDNKHLFIGNRAPYSKLSRTVCRSDLNKLIKMVGGTPIKGGGFHIVRRTYASNLLKTKNKISDIALALGHTTNETVNEYLNINADLEYLCPLELDLIPYGGKPL